MMLVIFLRYTVTSCIVFTQGPCKNEYRTFNIPKELSGNDVGSLEHVIQKKNIIKMKE